MTLPPTQNRLPAQPTRNRGGRPDQQTLAENPPVKAETIPIPTYEQGIRNPPCCGRTMVPRNRKRRDAHRIRCECSLCGRALIITHDKEGRFQFIRMA